MKTHFLFMLALLVLAAHGGEEFDPSTLKDFAAGGVYLDKYEMGLYPGGAKTMPDSHRKAGERLAAALRPLDAEGKVDEKNGKLVALVLGHSNCKMYFESLQAQLKQNSSELHPRFEMLNAAVGGQQLPEISSLKGGVWDVAMKLTSRPGNSPQQVQVLFLHTTYHGWKNTRNSPPRPFPETMKSMQSDLAKVLAHCVKTYPNLRIAYLTADGLRHFTGFEPHVWQESFGIKWLIESQIKGEDGTAFEDKDGKPRVLPWLAWGPYFRDNTWDKSYFTDGVHPAPKARAIFVQKYWEFLKSDATVAPWYLKGSK